MTPMPEAIILCGGQGVRLRPLTTDIPKPLVPVRGRPIIDFIVEFLHEQQIANITIAGGYLVNKLTEHFVTQPDVRVIDTGDVDIIERLKLLVTDQRREYLIIYGDTLSDVNLSELITSHRASQCAVTVTVWPLKSNFGVFDLDDESVVINYQEKPELNKWINIGYFILSGLAIDALQQFLTFEDFLTDLTVRGELFAFQHRGLHITINSRAELEDAENLLGSHRD